MPMGSLPRFSGPVALSLLLLGGGCRAASRSDGLFLCDIHSFAPALYRYDRRGRSVTLVSQGEQPIGRRMAAEERGSVIRWGDGRWLAYALDRSTMTLSQTFLPLNSVNRDSCSWR